jgi:hypothetical protein
MEIELSLPAISELLLGELHNFSEIFIVLDVLNEFGVNATPREIVIEELKKLQPKLRLIVTDCPFVTYHISIFEIYETLEIQAIEI